MINYVSCLAAKKLFLEHPHLKDLIFAQPKPRIRLSKVNLASYIFFPGSYKSIMTVWQPKQKTGGRVSAFVVDKGKCIITV